jgi:hypothetical protein
MPIDPSISLGVRPPVIQPLQIQSPLEQYGKVLTLRNLMQEQQSGQLGLQAQQLKLQQEQKGIQEDANIRQLYATNPNPSHAEIISTVGPVRGAALIKAQAEQYEQQLKTNAAKAARIGQLAGSAVDAPTYKNAIMTAVTENLIPADHGRELAALDWNDPATQAQVKQFQTQALTAEQQHTAALADLEEKRKAALAPAELATKQAESEQKQRQIEASTLAPALARGAVAYQQALSALPPARAVLYSGFQTPRDLLMFASTPTEQITAQQAAATAAATEKQHGVQNAFEQTRINIEKQRQAREENIYQQTYGAGANQSLVGVDPKLRTQATKEAQKMGDDFAKAQAAADQFQSLVDLTKSGNKAAGSNLPLIGVETLNAINGIKRINKDEIKQYGSAGSLYDKIVGKLAGAAIGQPISADVLKDIEAMHNTLRQNSEAEFTSRRKGLNDVYKSNFPTEVTRKTPTAAPGHVIEINGKRYQYKGSGPTESMDSYTEVKP